MERNDDKSTVQLPIHGEASLYSGFTYPFHKIRQFRKEEPEAYMTVGSLLKDESFSASKRVLVRENRFGFVPVLLAIEKPDTQFIISSWMADRRDIFRKNAESNLVENRVNCITEGLYSQDGVSYDTAVLIHEQHQNPNLLVYEAARVISRESCSVLFFATHKKKGGVSVSERIAQELGLETFWSKKGVGGAMIVKFVKKQPLLKPEIPISSFDYEPKKDVQIKFETTPSLFSTENIDLGTSFLIHNILTDTDPNEPISVYDVACGYGAIGLSLAACLNNAHVVMSDADARATDMAQRNINSMNLGANVSVLLRDGAKEIEDIFDLVVSNPPLHIDKPKLLEVIKGANRRVKKGGKMVLVVEDSRAGGFKELLKQYIGFVSERAKISSHSILEIVK